MEWTYTTIIHPLRKQLGLSNNEYTLLDTINKLSTNPKSKISGWCYARQSVLAENVGISRRAITNMISKMQSRGLLIKKTTTTIDPKTGDKCSIVIYRTSKEWYDVVVLGIRRNFQQGYEETSFEGTKKLPTGYEETSYIDSNIDNNKNINTMSDSKNPTAFDIFWDKFNHKVGSKKACRTYFNRLSKANQDHAIKIIPLYHEWLQITGTSIKQPLGWLKKYLDTDFKALISQERAKSGKNTPTTDLVAIRKELKALHRKYSPSGEWKPRYSQLANKDVARAMQVVRSEKPDWFK